MLELGNCHTMCQNMENFMYLWRGTERVFFSFGDQPNGMITKLVSVNDHIFIATTTYNLYHGKVECYENKAPTLILKRAQFYAVDIACNNEYVFIVNAEGFVLKVNPEDLSILDTVILKEELKYCIHGFKQENEIKKVKAIAINDATALYVTENGQLWASGDQPQINIKSSEPKKVIFFEGRVVSEVACGVNFNVVIVRKISKSTKEDTDSENDLEEEVFIKSCPQCINTTIPSPGSVTSSDTCPMELHAPQFSDDHSMNSISAMSNTSKDDARKNAMSPVEDSMNGENCFNESSEQEKESKKNVMFINTEAARQFLTRQLSWVSSYGSGKDEVFSENTDNPTKLIKQNVSNMANLVYEGVKTVGDKVVTLSRHVSGSSDINGIQDDISDSLEEQGVEESKRTASSLVNSLRCEEFPWSSSVGSSEHDLSQQGLNERINVLVRSGNNLLSTEFWTWGDVKYGQLGTGDNINRPRPVLISKLNLTGIKKVACGAFHTLALTLDGRVYSWGRNNHMQVRPDSEMDQSSPQLFSTNSCSKERAKDVSAGSNHSLVMMHHGIFTVGKYSTTGKVFKMEVPDESKCILKHVFCSGPYSCCTVVNQSTNDILENVINEQIFLEEMILVYQNLLKPFQKKGAVTQESNIYETLCRCYTELLSITALNVLSLLDYYNQIGEAYDVIIIANVEEYITVYKYYLNSICGIISYGGFAHIAKTIQVPQILANSFINNAKSHETKKANNELTIMMALQHPLRRLSRYKSMVQNLIRCNGPKMGIERLQEALNKWEQMCEEQDKRQREAEATKVFWENSGKLIDSLRSPERRLIRESRAHPISLLNSGRFTTHSFVLLTDIFVHICGTSYTVHPLPTLWVEPLSDSDTLQNALSITAPEDNLVLYTPSPPDRNDWLQALQNSIKNNLQKIVGHVLPAVRTSTFFFTKHPVYKDAKYTGRWLNGKPHGSGKLEWSDGSLYVGQFHKGVISGFGKMEMLNQGIYEGHWKDGKQNGFGVMKFVNGDVYEGYFKDGLPHGHGMKKEGHFMASGATVYIGEWAAGMKQGYGIMDDIMKGEKYLGSWNNNTKHGRGLIVTLDGIYYEGDFVQDVLTGHGVMVFEDSTHYEGEFKAAGIFCGKGTLTFRSGDILEGSMSGSWNEGVKVTATLHINKTSAGTEVNTNPKSFGTLCVPPDQKWKAMFRHCYQQLGVAEPGTKTTSSDKVTETKKLWQNVAVIITKSYEKNMQLQKKDFLNNSIKKEKHDPNDQLNKILYFGMDELTLLIYEQIHKYLTKAFESPHHPLGTLLNDLATVYTASYGGVRVHPLLLNHAVAELQNIASRIYDIVTLFFPALPPNGQELVLKVEGQNDGEVINATAILYPILLPRVHSALFVLYALHNTKKDDAYWKRLVKWNKQPDITLMSFLGVDEKFYKNSTLDNSAIVNSEPLFNEAIETLQQLKTTFSPLEKLIVIKNTFKKIMEAVQKHLNSKYLISMDELFPVFYFIVVRASVLQLGSEIQFIDDFMESYLKNGELDHMFTTLKACYCQILQEKMTTGD